MGKLFPLFFGAFLLFGKDGDTDMEGVSEGALEGCTDGCTVGELLG